MVKYILKRLGVMFPVFLLFLTALFFLLELQPGDITQQFIGNPEIPPEAQDILAARLGLDKPVAQRYVIYMLNFFRGEFGVSFSQYPREVGDLILSAIPRTLVLFLSATLLAYYIGFATGKVLAWRRGKGTEYALTLGGVGLYTVFYPWFALLMLWAFGFILDIFPIGKFIDVDEWSGAQVAANTVFGRLILSAIVATLLLLAIWTVSRRMSTRVAGARVRRFGFWAVVAATVGYWWFSSLRSYAGDIVHHTLLPTLTLASVAFAGIMLLTRSSMLETLREDYIMTARAKGLSEKVIRDRHAARNALLPVVTSLVLALAFVIGGGIITETIFSWPGIGSLLLDAVSLEDIPVAMGVLGFIGVLALIGHLVADILYMYLDPRIRYQ